MSLSDNAKRVWLWGSDGNLLVVEEAVAMESKTIKDMMMVKEESDEEERITEIPKLVTQGMIKFTMNSYSFTRIPKLTTQGISTPPKRTTDPAAYSEPLIHLPNMRREILSKVIDYCKKHFETVPKADHKFVDEDLKIWDAQFVKLHHDIIFDLIHAAMCLQIKSLLDLLTQGVADMMKGNKLAEIRENFGIQNDSTTAEQEKEIVMVENWSPYCFDG